MAEPGMIYYIFVYCIWHSVYCFSQFCIINFLGDNQARKFPSQLSSSLLPHQVRPIFGSTQHDIFECCQLSFRSFNFFFGRFKFSCRVFIFFQSFSVIDEAFLIKNIKNVIFSVCLFKSFCFWEAYFKEAAFSTDGQLSSTPPMEITKFDEGDCRVVSFETKEVAVEAEEAQLLEVVDEPAGPIKETKK